MFFSQEDVDKLAAPFRLSLVGKFSHGHLKIEAVKKFFVALDIKDTVSVGYLDARHVFIQCNSESDFHRIWTRGIW